MMSGYPDTKGVVHRQSDAKRSHKGASEPFDVPEIDQSCPDPERALW